MELKTLYSPEKIGNVQIKNRIVRSATFMRSTEKYGFVGQNLINIYSELARGGTGLIISGYTAVDPSGTSSAYQACLYDDSFIPGQKKLVKAVHEYTDVKIAAQIVHAGRQGEHPKYPPIAPSAIPFKMTGLTPRELSTEEIRKLIQKFIDTGRRAYECGYDLVQLHAAHGYLLSNFISPYTNKRTDEYGGNAQKRVRVLIDIYNGLRDELGKNFPITIKLQTEDFIPNGLRLEDGAEHAKILSEVGYDAIEPSGGGGDAQTFTKKPYPSLNIKSSKEENYFLPHVKKIRPYLKNCKLILMGGIKNPIFAEKVLQDKIVDFISMCRPLIYEPNLPNRWKSGDLSPAKCISCNGCFMSMRIGPVYCVTKKRLEDTREKRKVINKK
ncbi:MAG: NADH:flavin oxidoreductase [Candidatus Lokiarchaeota archaeon]|nr:NADH:flavin oxidoreductase [Candidatus Lokiarchaeota archaeon]